MTAKREIPRAIHQFCLDFCMKAQSSPGLEALHSLTAELENAMEQRSIWWAQEMSQKGGGALACGKSKGKGGK